MSRARRAWPLVWLPLLAACSALVPRLAGPALSVQMFTPVPTATVLTWLAPSNTPPSTATPTLTPEPSPTPTPLRLAVADDVWAHWEGYFSSLPSRFERLELVRQAPDTLEDSDAALLHWAPGPSAQEGLAVREEPYVAVTHVGAPRPAWTLPALVDMASGADSELRLVMGDDGTVLRQVLGIERPPPDALVLPDWEACKEHVAAHEGTWALVPWDVADFRVQAVPCDGYGPSAIGQDGYPLSRRLVLRQSDALPPDLLQDLHHSLGYAAPPTAELVAVGDIMLGRNVELWARQSSWRYPFEGEGIQTTLASADVAMGNLECVLSPLGQRRAKSYTFRADPQAFDGLLFAGFDLLVMANNHTGDYGSEALQDTLSRAQEAGLVTVGAGKNLAEAREARLVTANGLRLAFLAYNAIGPRWLDAAEGRPGSAPMVVEQMVADVQAAAAIADVVIVSCHWGIEYSAYPTAEQRRIAQALSEAGAALIVGVHPHVVQGLDYHANTLTAYSLGNFVFDMLTPDRQEGVMLRCLLDVTGVKTAELIPYRIERGQPRLLSQEAGASILARIAQVTAQQGRFPR